MSRKETYRFGDLVSFMCDFGYVMEGNSGLLCTSSGEWNGGNGANETSPPRPTCDNHDDGETVAIIVCDSCGNLCGDCDRFLHLHRRTKDHQRQVGEMPLHV